jgi:AcrR family transcriptional regulator
MKLSRRSRSTKSRARTDSSRTPTASLPRRPNLLAGEDLPRMPAQRRSRVKRAALLKAGVELFERHGYDATSIGAIARRAGVAVGGFYQYFRSKRQLLIVLMNELLQKLEQIDMQPRGGLLRDRIEDVLRAGATADLAYMGAYRAWKEAILADPKLASLDERVRTWTTARLGAVFIRLQQLPGARTGIDVRLFAATMDRLFWDLLGGRLESAPRVVEVLGHVIYHSLFQDRASG